VHNSLSTFPPSPIVHIAIPLGLKQFACADEELRLRRRCC